MDVARNLGSSVKEVSRVVPQNKVFTVPKLCKLKGFLIWHDKVIVIPDLLQGA